MATIRVTLFEAPGRMFRPDRKVLVSIRDHKQKTTSIYKELNVVNFNVDLDEERPDHNDYAVLASSGDRSDVGFFPVTAAAGDPVEVDLLLRPRQPSYNFAAATWEAIRLKPRLHDFLAAGDDEGAMAAFNQLKETPRSMACLLNIVCAIDLLPLADDDRLLPLFKRIELVPGTTSETKGVCQDRLFAWAEPRIKDILKTAKDAGRPLFGTANSVLHRNASGGSFKELRFGEANLQFTFHEGETAPAGTDWVKVEVDMDCYHDVGAHILLEVIPNEFITRVFKPHLTDPANIYALRWMAGRHVGEGRSPAPGQPVRPEFAPLYTV